jgi:hypothetical protein
MTNQNGNPKNTARAKPNTQNSLKYIKARILWPALGFPSVIAPGTPLSFLNGTNCIELLILSDKSNLLALDVAGYLRYVPWNRRHCRYLKSKVGSCSFSVSDIEVKKVISKNNGLVQEVSFVGWPGQVCSRIL